LPTDLLELYIDRERVVVASFDAHQHAGRIMATLAVKEDR